MAIDNDLQQLIDARAQRGPFDSHDVVHDFRARFSAEYAALLRAAERRVARQAHVAQSKKKPSAVHRLHTALGIRIARLCQAAGLYRTPSRSLDVHGQHSRCLAWTMAGACDAPINMPSGAIAASL